MNCYNPVKVPSSAGGKCGLRAKNTLKKAAAVDEWEIIGVVGLVWLYACVG